MCNSCGLDHPPPSRWLLARGIGVLAAGAIAAAVLLVHGAPSRSAAARPVASNSDRVFASDNCLQETAGRALASAGEQSTVPDVRRVAAQLARLERSHAARASTNGCRTTAASPPMTTRPAYLRAVRDHLESDVLVARIERSEGTDPRLRRRAAAVISRVQPVLASLPRG